jgi:flavin reductase (DIM6/NTAB) family NADH-FMN oxidoreductase RutF
VTSVETETGKAVAQDAFKVAMAEICSPVTILTTMHDGAPHGTTVSAFTSLSLDPPMIMAALDRRSELLPKIEKTGVFGVNVLSSEQSGLASSFSRKSENRFNDIDWVEDGMLPRIAGSSVWLSCRIESIIDGGDHAILVAAVEDGSVEQLSPLTYHRRVFGTHAPHAA